MSEPNDCGEDEKGEKCLECDIKEACPIYLGHEPTAKDYSKIDRTKILDKLLKFMDMTTCVACKHPHKTNMADKLPPALKRLWRELKICPFCAWQLDAFTPTLINTRHLTPFQRDSVGVQKCRGMAMAITQYTANFREDKIGTLHMRRTINYLLYLLNMLHDMMEETEAAINRNVTQVMTRESFLKMSENKDIELFWYIYFLLDAQAKCGGLEKGIIPEELAGKARQIVKEAIVS